MTDRDADPVDRRAVRERIVGSIRARGALSREPLVASVSRNTDAPPHVVGDALDALEREGRVYRDGDDEYALTPTRRGLVRDVE